MTKKGKKKAGGKVDVNLRRNVSWMLYEDLPQAEKDRILTLIKEEHKVELDAWDAVINGPVATDPLSRQG